MCVRGGNSYSDSITKWPKRLIKCWTCPSEVGDKDIVVNDKTWHIAVANSVMKSISQRSLINYRLRGATYVVVEQDGAKLKGQ